MRNRFSMVILAVLVLAALQTGMARKGQYDEEARAREKMEKELQEASKASRGERLAAPAKNVAEGVKEATIDSTAALVSETADQVAEEPVTGTLEGARVGGAKAVTTAAKGVFKVATLGYGDTENMQVEQPKADTDDVTKFKIGF